MQKIDDMAVRRSTMLANQRSILMWGSPFFTLITASFNSKPTVKKTIVSIKDQTFQNLEHIIIDGDSSDGTMKVLREFESTYNISWISEPDCGIADALNKGLRKAKGRYIIVIQADDCLLNANSLEKAYSILKYERPDILSLPVIYNHPRMGKQLIKPIRLLWWNHLKHIFHHQGCFVHKRVFEKIGEFRSEFEINMDYDFFYRALDCKSSVHFGKFPVVLMGGSGISSVYAYERIKEERLVQILNERNPGWRTAQFIFRLLYLPYKKHLLSHYHSFNTATK
jgi:glycosyltransferase involved in cell wall biosynthesis